MSVFDSLGDIAVTYGRVATAIVTKGASELVWDEIFGSDSSGKDVPTPTGTTTVAGGSTTVVLNQCCGYEISDGFVLHRKSGRVWKYDEEKGQLVDVPYPPMWEGIIDTAAQAKAKSLLTAYKQDWKKIPSSKRTTAVKKEYNASVKAMNKLIATL